MWIVRLALSRPYTFIVAALLLILLSPFVLLRTPTDIFPVINIPVVSIIWQFTGLSADQIESRMVYVHERALTTTVDTRPLFEFMGFTRQTCRACSTTFITAVDASKVRVDWTRRFILHFGKRHPRDMGAAEVERSALGAGSA